MTNTTVQVPVPPVTQNVTVNPPAVALPIIDTTKGGITATMTGAGLQIADSGGGPTPPPGYKFPPGTKITMLTAAAIRSAPNADGSAGKQIGTGSVGTAGSVVGLPIKSNNTFNWLQIQFTNSTPTNLLGFVGDDNITTSNPNPPIVVVGAAFPGAMGGGAAAVGARSSSAKVIEVTNLNDTGSGSLRAALAASGPRYVIPRVAGLIAPQSRMTVNPFCTLVGRCSPGGITLGGPNQKGEVLFISGHDVIIRDMSYDGCNPNNTPGPDNGTVGFELASGLVHDVIFDHCSLRWWSNKGFVTYANGQTVTNVTLQNSLMYEPNVGHPVGPMTDASMLAELSVDQDFHHNFLINQGHRMPLYNTKRGRWVNNTLFNWDYFALLAQGGVDMDIIGNRAIRGNLNGGNNGNPHPFQFSAIQSTDDTTQKMPGPGSFFLLGNFSDQYQTNPAGDQTVMCAKLTGEGTPEVGPVPASWFRSSPLAPTKYAIIADDESTLDSLLPTIGNAICLLADGTLATSNRDTQDARVVAQFIAKGKGDQYKGNGYNGSLTAPPRPAGTPWVSSQHDGISDQWKQLMQLDTSDPNLYNKISQKQGLPIIECYHNGLVP